MKWRRARASEHVEDRRGGGRHGGGGIGLVGMAVVVVIALLLGEDPLRMLGLLQQSSPSPPAAEAPESPENQASREFVARILGESEDVFAELFSARGQRYRPARLVLFSDQVESACGSADAAVGPFYCPADKTIYLDTSFFEAMRRRLGGGGDFAEAYVIAHEVGHHVQTLSGTTAAVQAARRRGEPVEGADGPLVRQELQADCYAGLWAHHAQRRHDWLEAGDIEEALGTASAIGDDALQRQGQGRVVPDSFTHGSSEQRIAWFKRGFGSGRFEDCDSFAARRL